MRTIKFRAKRKSDNEFACGFLVGRQFIGKVIHNSIAYPELSEYSEIDDDTIGQFTGLLDKNGKEVFEGDVVMFEYLGNHISEVKSDIVGYYIENNGHKKELVKKFRLDFPFKNLEVIGNIYENPELLIK
jgi:uncharacterized phage protein (TIGR01671 family)